MSDQRIYKYDVGKEPLCFSSLMLPKGARVLEAAEQDNIVRIWALVDVKEKVQQGRIFFIAGTGIDVPFGPALFHGCVRRDPFVWHVLEWDFRNPGSWYRGADGGVDRMAREFLTQEGPPEFGPPAVTGCVTGKSIPEPAVDIALVMWFESQTWYVDFTETKADEYRARMRTILEFGASCATTGE